MSNGTRSGPDWAESARDELSLLLQRVKAGDEPAACAVVSRLYDQVRRIVMANLPRRDDPEDLMQDVFLKVFSRLSQYRAEVPFENWVSRVALSTCLDRLRRQRSRPEWRWADLSEEERAAFESLAAEQEHPEVSPESARDLLNRLLEKLKPEERLLIRYLDLEQRTIAEVCALTGWNSGVTRIRAFRARRRLRALFRQLEAPSEA